MMKKLWLTVACALSFSALASGADTKLKKESFLSSVVTHTKQSPQVTKQVSSGDVKVSRRQQAKKVRNKSQLEKVKGQKKYRPESPSTAERFHYFDIYDSWVTLNYDKDGDGYFSEFTVNFDANFSGGYADVFADIYLSLEGGSWVHIVTTDAFTIYGSDDDDYYRVTTLLNRDFPTGEYDILIDLYEVGFSGIVATAGPNEDGDLFSLPLEDSEHELNSDATLITYVASELSTDFDADGFYTRLTLEYDIDTLDSGRMVYAEIDLTNSTSLHRRTVSTVDFQLGNQTEFIDLVFEGGYVAGWYDIEIRLIDVYTGQVLANAAQDFSSLTQLPIESDDYDDHYDNPNSSQGPVSGGSSVVVHESGGGSFGFVLLGLGLLAVRRRQN
ncbi:choice-of-anchor H family protein [Aliikangiella coralliicola]|uniref:GlyGly-CTERM sorting domain-containing protein n=1 Tax=Aliikangiella coralliicola TaxID=2592383 RepID=A0A545TZX8_9GAMM|nr:choice-of-anchor H family protein [Aliikangiella coralliicola]TQV82767.1 hypothetical protein FLL46_23625 [Aliikangiella coralliicola]